MTTISDQMEQTLNKHMNVEFYSAYLYLSMEAYFTSTNWLGFAKWSSCQANEELAHAMKFYNYILERGSDVKLLPIEAPPATWDSPLAVFQSAYENEKQITTMINSTVDLAIEIKDHATNIFLQWFVTEQMEEELMTNSIVERVQLAGDSVSGLLLLDNELGKRTATT